MQEGINILTELGRFGIAAKHQKEIAEIYETYALHSDKGDDSRACAVSLSTWKAPSRPTTRPPTGTRARNPRGISIHFLPFLIIKVSPSALQTPACSRSRSSALSWKSTRTPSASTRTLRASRSTIRSSAGRSRSTFSVPACATSASYAARSEPQRDPDLGI